MPKYSRLEINTDTHEFMSPLLRKTLVKCKNRRAVLLKKDALDDVDMTA